MMAAICFGFFLKASSGCDLGDFLVYTLQSFQIKDVYKNCFQYAMI